MKNNGFIQVQSRLFIILWLVLFSFCNTAVADKEWSKINQHANKYFKSRQYQKAGIWAKKSLEYAKKNFGEQDKKTIRSMTWLAEMYAYQKRFDLAESLLLKLLPLKKSVLGEEHPDTLASMYTLANTYAYQFRYDLAEPLYIKTLALSKAVLGEKHSDTLMSMYALANAFAHQDRYDLAEPLYIKTLALRGVVLGKKHPDTLMSMDALATLYFNKVDFQSAKRITMDTFALRKVVQGESHPDTLKTMCFLAEIHRAQAHLDLAEKLLIEALDLTNKALGENHPAGISCEYSLGNLYQDQGRYSKAEFHHHKAMATRKAQLGEQHPDTVQNMTALATLYMAQNQFQLAEPFWLESLAIQKTQFGEQHSTTLLTMSRLAHLYQVQGLLSSSETLYLEILAIIKNKDDIYPLLKPSVMHGLAITYMRQERYFLAEPILIANISFYKTTLKKRNTAYINSIANLGALYELMGRLDEAESLLKKAISLRKASQSEKRLDILTTRINLAKVYMKQKRYKLAEQTYNDMLNLIKTEHRKNHRILEAILGHLAVLYFKMNQYENAGTVVGEALIVSELFLQQVLWAASEKTRSSYIQQEQDGKDLFFSIFNLHKSEANSRRALALSLNRKGLLLQIATQVQALSRSSNKPELRQLAESLTDNHQRLTALMLDGKNKQAEIQVLEEKISQQQAKLGKEVQQIGQNSSTVTPEQLIASLDTDSAFVDFVIYRPYVGEKETRWSPEHLMAIVVSRQKELPIQLVSLGEIKPIEKDVKLLLARMESERTNVYAENSVALYKRLWEPLEPFLNNKKQVYIAPDGILNILPFSVLKKAKDQPFLIEKFQINMVSSGRDIVLPPMVAEQTPPAIIAAPLYSPSQLTAYNEDIPQKKSIKVAKRSAEFQFSPLPSALKEGAIIKELLQTKGYKVNYYSLAAATEKAIVNIKSPKILHFATHGFYQEDVSNSDSGRTENPLLRSGLALTNANLVKQELSEDGILTAEEILDLDLAGTDLVVLSACETGLGEVVVNEGVFGLKRAFQNAGAKAVLSTLWEVHSVSSKDFMIEFYNYFLEGMSPQKALRQTQLDFINHSGKQPSYGVPQHPMHWAPFTIVGGKSVNNADTFPSGQKSKSLSCSIPGGSIE